MSERPRRDQYSLDREGDLAYSQELQCWMYDELEQLLKEKDKVAAALALFQWQPIETAPMKTPILVTNGKEVTVTLLSQLRDKVCMCGAGFDGVEWEYDMQYDEITHWLALPPLPSK